MQLFDLANRDSAVGAFEHALDETALGVARAIRKLWHAKKSYGAELIAQFENNLAPVTAAL
jgi:hypothetical protein